MMLICSRAFSTDSIAQGTEPPHPAPPQWLIGIDRAGHRRQHDWEFGLEKVQKSTIRPHGLHGLWFA
jgi:hypothetical protein